MVVKSTPGTRTAGGQGGAGAAAARTRLEQLVEVNPDGQARSAAATGDLGNRLQLVVGARPAPKRSGGEGGAAVAEIGLEQLVDVAAHGQARSADCAGDLRDKILPIVKSRSELG